jgi:hypothetical protein
MRRQWSVRRTRQPEPDGQRRWDQAYQEVLAWTEAAVSGKALAAAPRKPPRREVPDESGSLGPGLDAAPSASTECRATTGPAEEVRRRARLARPDRERFP